MGFLVIIDQFNVTRTSRQVFFQVSRLPDEANTPLVIDADAMLAELSAFQGFQAVARRDTQAIQTHSSMKKEKFTKRRFLNVCGKLPRTLVLENLLGF